MHKQSIGPSRDKYNEMLALLRFIFRDIGKFERHLWKIKKDIKKMK